MSVSQGLSPSKCATSVESSDWGELAVIQLDLKGTPPPSSLLWPSHSTWFRFSLDYWFYGVNTHICCWAQSTLFCDKSSNQRDDSEMVGSQVEKSARLYNNNMWSLQSGIEANLMMVLSSSSRRRNKTHFLESFTGPPACLPLPWWMKKSNSIIIFSSFIGTCLYFTFMQTAPAAAAVCNNPS